MGTLFTITLYAKDRNTADTASKAAFQKIADLDHCMTDYDPNSELMRLSRHAPGEAVKVSPDLFAILKESEGVSRETDGAYDITVGPFVRAWRETRRTGVLPSPEAIESMRGSIGCQKLRLSARDQTVTLLAPNMQLDLGGIAKGYAADQALQLLRRLGIKSALVAASGDIAIGDAPPGTTGWKVGIIEIDGAPEELSRTVLLHNAGISTSGDSEQNVEIDGVRYSHIVDPRTGLGLTNHIQVTVVGPNATISDGLDTPLGILGVKKAMAFADARPDLAILIITRDKAGDHFLPSKKFHERFSHK